MLNRRLMWARGATAGLVAVGGGVWAVRAGGTKPAEGVYTIGTDNAIPYHFLAGDGRISGMVAEVLQEGDAVLMDRQMPGMDGLEATAEIRKREVERGRRRLSR